MHLGETALEVEHLQVGERLELARVVLAKVAHKVARVDLLVGHLDESLLSPIARRWWWWCCCCCSVAGVLVDGREEHLALVEQAAEEYAAVVLELDDLEHRLVLVDLQVLIELDEIAAAGVDSPTATTTATTNATSATAVGCCCRLIGAPRSLAKQQMILEQLQLDATVAEQLVGAVDDVGVALSVVVVCGFAGVVCVVVLRYEVLDGLQAVRLDDVVVSEGRDGYEVDALVEVALNGQIVGLLRAQLALLALA